jgi:Tol biopolymer transport system component
MKGRQVPRTWLALGAMTMAVAACGGGGGNGGGGSTAGGPPANRAPTADAGADRAVGELATITLMGQASDPEGGPLVYSWSQASGPAVDFATPDEATTDVTVPRVDIGTAPTIVLRLTVTDDQSAVATDDVSIAVSSTDFLVFIADKEIDGVQELFLYDPEAGGTRKLSGPLVAGGDVVDFKLSPDGTAVAYRADQDIDGQIGLYVARVDGSGVARVSSGTMIAEGDVAVSGHSIPYGASPEDAYSWSPDSTQLVYTADAEIDEIFEVYLVAPDGSGHRKINGNTANGSVYLDDVRWSPDGRYVSQRVRSASTHAVLGINTHDTLAGGPNSVRVNPTISMAPAVFDYGWSPQGDRIAYIGNAVLDTRPELFVVNPDGTGHTKVSSGYGGMIGKIDVPVSSMAWSPDGSRLAYIATFTFGQPELFTVSPDGSGNLRVNGALTSPDFVGSFRWSPDSRRLAYALRRNLPFMDHELYAVNADGSGLAQISASLPAAGRGVRHYTWSPDSARLAFRMDTDTADEPRLYAADADGGNLARVDADPVAGGFVLSYRWTPDGNSLIYVADQESDDVFEVYVADADGANRRKLSGEAPIRLPDQQDLVLYSADRSRLAVRSGPPNGPVTIRMMAPDGTGSVDVSGPMVSGGNVVTLGTPMRWSP